MNDKEAILIFKCKLHAENIKNKWFPLRQLEQVIGVKTCVEQHKDLYLSIKESMEFLVEYGPKTPPPIPDYIAEINAK